MPYSADGAYFCVLCGTRNDPRARVCAKCGCRIVTPADFERDAPRKPTGWTARDDAGNADEAGGAGDTGGEFDSADVTATGETGSPRSRHWLNDMALDQGLWLIVPVLVFGAILFCVGLQSQLNGEFTAGSFTMVGIGAAVVWVTQRAIRQTADAYRNPKVFEYPPDPVVDFGPDGHEYWRIPGYGTDAEENPTEEPGLEMPDDDQRPPGGNR